MIDATIVSAPKQRNTDVEKADIRASRIPAGWKDKPAKLAQKDRDAALGGLLTGVFAGTGSSVC